VTTDPNTFSVTDLYAPAAGQQVIGDLLRENVGVGKIIGVFRVSSLSQKTSRLVLS